MWHGYYILQPQQWIIDCVTRVTSITWLTSVFKSSCTKHTSRELTILIFPKKWFRYPCIAIFALSAIVCCLPKAGRRIGRAALDGTSLDQRPTYKQLIRPQNNKSCSSKSAPTLVAWKRRREREEKKRGGGIHLCLTLSSGWCKEMASSSASSSSCTTGVASPIPRFWSHSLTFNIMFQQTFHQNPDFTRYGQSNHIINLKNHLHIS